MINDVNCWFYASKNANCKGFSGTDAFTVPAPGVLGNTGRNNLRGPGTAVFDFSLDRNFRVTERAALQLRWEVFNLANSKNLKKPEVTSLLFNFDGTVTSGLGDPRQAQLGVKLIF